MNVIQSKDATIGGIPDDESLSDIINEINFYLPSFIKTLYIAGTNYGNTTQSGIIISPSLIAIEPKLAPNRVVHSPSRDLYYNMFKYLCVTDTGGEPIFTAGNVTHTFDLFDLPTFPKKGYFMEGALMLAMYIIRLQLRTDVPPELIPPGFIRTNKILYKKLKKQYDDFLDTGSITPPQLEGLINPDLDKFAYIKDQLQKTYPQKSLSNSYYFDKLNNIQTSIQQTISDTVRKKAFKYLKALGWAQENPDYHFISIGNGSNTNGILNIPRAGLMLFEYDYQSTRDIGGMVSGQFIYPSYLNKQSLLLENKNFVHLNLFGINDNNNGSAILERNFNGSTSRFLLTTQSGTSNPMNLKSEGNLINDSNLKNKLYPIPSSLGYIWRDTNNADEINLCINKLLGRWNETTNDMSLFDNEGDFSVYLRTDRNKLQLDAEELFLIVCACKEDVEVTIELEHIYDEDRFELSNTQRLANIDNDDVKKAFIDFMVSQIRNDKCEVEIQMLKGGFVGKLITPTPLPNLPKVESDIDYLFDLTVNNETPIGNKFENAGSGNSALLYSFGKIVFKKAENVNSKNKFIISIESYCSAEWSRLDRRLHFDIRNYGHTLTINGNSNAPVTSGSTGMDKYTIFGQNSSTDAKIHSGPPEGSGPSIDIASYNHLLTQLRSIGLLEAIFISATVLDKSRTCAVDPNKVQAFLIDVLSNISIPTHTQNQIPLTYADYLRFKWYDIVTSGSSPWLPVPNGAGGYDIAPDSNPTDFKSLTDL